MTTAMVLLGFDSDTMIEPQKTVTLVSYPSHDLRIVDVVVAKPPAKPRKLWHRILSLLFFETPEARWELCSLKIGEEECFASFIPAEAFHTDIHRPPLRNFPLLRAGLPVKLRVLNVGKIADHFRAAFVCEELTAPADSLPKPDRPK